MAEDEAPPAAKSAEDRKAASALASLDSSAAADDATNTQIDHEAVAKAMKGLPAQAGAKPSAAASDKPAPKKAVKLAPVDVALVVDQLELAKPRATELLKQNDGDAVAVLRLFASGKFRE